MNYFQKHLGDYAKKTGHLTALEHGVYNLILDAYYDREKGPTLIEATRWARARTEEEKSAVLAVLDEFFTIDEHGRHTQARVEEEIAKAAELMEDADGKRDNERERQRRHRDRRKELFARLRYFDEVPPWDTKTEQLQLRLDTHLSRVTNERRTPDATANHYPLPITHTQPPEEQEQVAPSAPAGDADPAGQEVEAAKPDPKFDPKGALLAAGVEKQKVVDFIQLRKTKKAPITLTALDGIQREAEKAGITLAAAVAVCCENGWAGFKADWHRGAGQASKSNGRPSINDIGVPKGADDDIFNQMRKELP